MNKCLPEFDVYQKLKQTHALDDLTFFQKKVLSVVRPEIHLVRRNIVSTGQSARA